MKKIDMPNPSASELALTSLIAGEHLLIEDIPGTGKTNLAKNLSHISKLRNNRIQCTNDLMPADEDEKEEAEPADDATEDSESDFDVESSVDVS